MVVVTVVFGEVVDLVVVLVVGVDVVVVPISVRRWPGVFGEVSFGVVVSG